MKLNKDNYFSPEAGQWYFSVSQFKEFMKCEAAALEAVNGNYQREKTTSLLVGSYVDAYFSGELERFKAENPEIFNSRSGALKSEYKKADLIIERLEADPMFMDYIGGESQVIMTGELFGYDWKIKVDSLHPDKIVDLKVMKDFQPVHVDGEGKTSFISAWGYDIQGAVYQEIVRQNTGKRLPFFVAAATKETVTDYGIWELSQDRLDIALKVVEYNIDHIADIKGGLEPPARCEKCDYCKQTKRLESPQKWED